MGEINNSLSNAWVQEVESRFGLTPKQRESLPLYKIIRSFKKEIESHLLHLDRAQEIDLAQKINILSKEKLDYYDSSRFGFIKHIFSILRNGFWGIGIFKSSGQLGFELSQNFLRQCSKEEDKENECVEEEQEILQTTPPSSVLPKKNKDEITIDLDKKDEEMKDQVAVEQELESSQTDDEKSPSDTFHFDSIDTTLDVKITEQKEPDSIFSDEDSLFYSCEEGEEEEKESPQTPLPSSPPTEIEAISIIAEEKPVVKEEVIVDEAIKISPKQVDNSFKAMTPKENMISTFNTIWKHASQEERCYIQKIWAEIVKVTEVVSWKSTDKTNEYQLELKKEIQGSHPKVPLSQFVIKQKMRIAFVEKIIPGTQHYQQEIHFPDEGIGCRLGIGWFSKNSALKQIVIGENESGIWCTVEALGQTITRSAENTLDLWKEAKWS